MNCSSVRNRPISPRRRFSAMWGRSTSRPAIKQQLHLFAVAGDARLVAQRKVLELPAGAEPDELDISGFEVGGRADMDLAARPRRR